MSAGERPVIPASDRPQAITATPDGLVVHLAALRKSAMLTAALGLLHSAFFVAAIYMVGKAPGPTATDAEIVEYYSGNERRWILAAGLYLLPFAGIAFIWFTVALRAWSKGYIRRENALLSNVQLVAGVIYTAVLFVAAASSSVSASVAEFSDHIDPMLARQFPQFGSALIFVFAMRMAAMFVLTTTNIMKSTKITPKWFTILGYFVALFLLLTWSVDRALVLVLPIWITIFCILVILRARRIPKTGSLVEIEAAGIVYVGDEE